MTEMIAKLGTLPLKCDPGAQFNYGISTDVVGYLQAPIDRRLEEAGFESVASVNLLMKETLVRVAEPALVPAGVR